MTLRAALRWAIKSKRISGDLPCIEVPSQPPPRDRWMTRDEADKLLASAQALPIRTPSLSLCIRPRALLHRWNSRGIWRTLKAELSMWERDVGTKWRGTVPINAALRPYLVGARQAATWCSCDRGWKRASRKYQDGLEGCRTAGGNTRHKPSCDIRLSHGWTWPACRCQWWPAMRLCRSRWSRSDMGITRRTGYGKRRTHHRRQVCTVNRPTSQIKE